MRRSRLYSLFNFVAASVGNAFLEIRAHKLRSFLSLIGITLGIASFITMTNLGDMNRRALTAFIAEIGGLNQVVVTQKRPVTPRDAYDYARSPGLRFSDLDSLRATLPAFAKDTRLNTQYDIHFSIDNEDYRVGVIGVNRDFLGTIKILHGRNITDEEYEQGAAVCMLTANLYKRMKKIHGIPPEKYLGRNLHLSAGFSLRVIGFFEKPMNGDWHIYRNGLFVPIRFYERNVSGVNVPQDQLYFQVDSTLTPAEAKFRIGRLLTALHRGVRDFHFEKEEGALNIDENMRKVTLTFAIITLLTLLVGGLNIMNVMLVSISTRIWEIGMRKAVGATNNQIFAQFLIESSALSLTGGLAGMGLGYLTATATASALAQSIPWLTPSFNSLILIQGALLSTAIGVLFGLYPAIKAFRLNPIAALHFE